MSSHGFSTVSLLSLFTVTILWLASASVQVGANGLQRDPYGAANGEFLAGYPTDRGEARPAARPERRPSRFGDANANVDAEEDGRRTTRDDAEKKITRRSEGRYLRGEQIDRFVRNLDQIGGGNLLRRRGLRERLENAYELPVWLTSRRNLDQIGGGNLLRSVDERLDRNLDQIGGGNLVRTVVGGEDRRSNLDQIGGGNLVRGLTEIEADP